MAYIVFSPAEVMMDIVKRTVDPEVVQHVVVGPLNHEQQQAGGISLMDAGTWKDDPTNILVFPRMQLRVLGPTLDRVEKIGRHAAFSINSLRGRMVGLQASTGESFLVHSVTVNGGPSAHQDTSETWEYLLFVEAMMGVTPIT